MVILDLVAKVEPLAEGMSVRLPTASRDEIALARAWCELSGNTVVSAADGWIEVRRGKRLHATESLAPERRPGLRLWIYTNFDCNLACRYCCVRSSPQAQRRWLRSDRIGRIAAEAATWGVAELWLTGGEPFMLPDIGDSIRACVALRPTAVLTNGMLFTGRRLQTLAELPRERLTLQISLDSPTAARHDRNRGAGSWARAMAGIRTARELGFHVRVAASVDPSEPRVPAELEQFTALLDELGVSRADFLIRPIARRGVAEAGVRIEPESTVPEVTVTADGVYWHPVGADDTDMLVDREIFPLARRIDHIIELFEDRAQRLTAAAMVFPCA